MKPTNTVAKLFSSVSTLAVVAGAIAFDSVTMGQVGAVLTWGIYDQATVPTACNSGVTAIAAGECHTIALKDGAVLAWGSNGNGQCGGTDGSGNPITSDFADGTVPVQINGVTLTGVTAIACCSYNTIALKDGFVLAWGSNEQGQCTIPTAAQSGVSAIAGGHQHTIALKDGAVLAWGSNRGIDGGGDWLGQCDVPAAAQSGVTAIAAGWYHTIALKNGGVLAWGANHSGQCNIPAAAQSGVTAIAGGGGKTIALKDGRVFAWGTNWSGECAGTDGSGNPITSDFADGTVPVQINGVTLTGVTAIAGEGFQTIALKDGRVLTWGVVTWTSVSDVPAAAQSSITAIAGGYMHAVAIKGNPNDNDCDGISNAADNCPSVANPTQADCDGNGVGDACEQQPDCNNNSIPDSCDIANGVAQDCNTNGILDSCEILSGAVTDINGNNIPDSCDVVSGLLNDYNHNGIADSAELVTVTAQLATVTAQLQCGDLDGSGDVGSEDLSLLLLNYGPCEGASLTTEQEPMIFQTSETANLVLKKNN